MALDVKINRHVIAKIKDTLLKVDRVETVIPYPFSDEPAGYPCAVFFPMNNDNAMLDTANNKRDLYFHLGLLINAENITDKKLYEEVLPDLADEVLENFDKDWNFGTLNGNRVWAYINNVVWGRDANKNGKEAYLNCQLRIQLATRAE